MMKLQNRFVELMPSEIEEGILYISMEFGTAIHKCVCGCGNKVVTPFAPDGWKLTYDGETVSIYPSIGNWNFDCKSHYFIVNNEIKQARRRDDKEIKQRRKDRVRRKKKSFKEKKSDKKRTN